MTDTEKILAMLNRGMTPEEIAENFTNSLNAAIDQQKVVDEKYTDTKHLLNHVNEYLTKYYPEVEYDTTIKEEDITSMVKFFDTLFSNTQIFKLFF